MNKKALAAGAAMIGLSVSGCATVLNGPNVDYMTTTEPAGASLRFSSGATCTSPCTLEFARRSDQRVDITLPGYHPTYVLIQSKLGGSAFGNIIAGGGIGAVVDGTNGASNRLYPRPLIVRLSPVGSSEGAVLLDENGNVTQTVRAHNDSVRVDVAKTVGPRLAGLEGNDPQ